MKNISLISEYKKSYQKTHPEASSPRFGEEISSFNNDEKDDVQHKSVLTEMISCVSGFSDEQLSDLISYEDLTDAVEHELRKRHEKNIPR